MAHNRLSGFRVVRQTKDVKFLHTVFLPASDGRKQRDAEHKEAKPLYPDANFYLNLTQKYFHRAKALRHLRLEQFHKYFVEVSDVSNIGDEDTPGLAGEDYQSNDRCHHKHFDMSSDGMMPGVKFSSEVHMENCSGKKCKCGMRPFRRRAHNRLGASRRAAFEITGEQREHFYEQRLLLTLPWYSSSACKRL